MTDIKFLGQTKTGVKKIQTLDTSGNAVVAAFNSITGDDIATHSFPVANLVLNTATTVKERSFWDQEGIVSVSSNTVKTLNNYCFGDISTLETVDFPAINGAIGGYTFQYCTSLTSLNVRGATSGGGYIFRGCTHLVNLALPKWTGASGTSLASGCSLLEKLDFGSALRFDASSVNSCPVLSVIVLRKTSALTTLSNVNAFSGTPFASGGTGGTIYIPKALYDHLGDETSLDYKAATNWSTVNGYGTITWAKIEGSTYETKTVDGADI